MRIPKLPSIILCYHRIGDETLGGHSRLSVSPSNFKSHLKMLRILGYDFVSLDSDRLGRKGTIAISFDDGYVDNLELALPILREFDCPVTIFISSYFVKSGENFVADQICDLDGSHMKKVRQLAKLPKESFLNEIKNIDKRGDKCTCSNGRPLSSFELIQLASDSLVTIGGHTELHRSLAEISPRELESELLAPIKFLQDLGIMPSKFYAIPFGQGRHASLLVSDKIRALGFEPLTTYPLTLRAKTSKSKLGFPRLSVSPGGKWLLVLQVTAVLVGSAIPEAWLRLLEVRASRAKF